jgi:hypothetical protein
MQQFLKIAVFLSILASGMMIPAASFPRALAASSSDNLVVQGLVSNPLNLTYAEVESLPQVSEIALLQCVDAPSGKPYNWTGVPLFYLLNLANVQPGAIKVVFYGSDGFSSSLTIDKAMDPTTLLALKVNGTTLPQTTTQGLPTGYPYKVVPPNKYGYKWVGLVDKIEVVNYDYLGTYESQGYSDDASIPNWTVLPETEPAYATLNITLPTSCSVKIFSNYGIDSAGFNQTSKRIMMSVTTEDNSDGFVYVVMPKKLLYPDFLVFLNGTTMEADVVQSQTNSFIYFAVGQGQIQIEVKGVLPADVTGPQGVSDGIVDMIDVAHVAQRFGTSLGSPLWDPRADLNADGTIDMQDIAMVASCFLEESQ